MTDLIFIIILAFGAGVIFWSADFGSALTFLRERFWR
jgi:hypothetical protein